MEKLPIQEKITELTENLKRRIGSAMIAGLERFDDAHDIDWGIEDDEEDPALFGRDLKVPEPDITVYKIPDNIVLGEN
jgi:hypothetical protein